MALPTIPMSYYTKNTDNILIHGASREQTYERLVIVLTSLHSEGLVASGKKFEGPFVEYCRFCATVSSSGVEIFPTEDKITAIQEYPLPLTSTQLRGFSHLKVLQYTQH